VQGSKGAGKQGSRGDGEGDGGDEDDEEITSTSRVFFICLISPSPSFPHLPITIAPLLL